jgi:hypothetical protein
MFLTREDYEKIEKYLKQNAKKDSQFKIWEDYSTLNNEDCVVVNRIIANSNTYENTHAKLKPLLDYFL